MNRRLMSPEHKLWDNLHHLAWGTQSLVDIQERLWGLNIFAPWGPLTTLDDALEVVALTPFKGDV